MWHTFFNGDLPNHWQYSGRMLMGCRDWYPLPRFLTSYPFYAVDRLLLLILFYCYFGRDKYISWFHLGSVFDVCNQENCLVYSWYKLDLIQLVLDAQASYLIARADHFCSIPSTLNLDWQKVITHFLLSLHVFTVSCCHEDRTVEERLHGFLGKQTVRLQLAALPLCWFILSQWRHPRDDSR